MERCTIGHHMNDGESCHSTTYTRQKKLIVVHELHEEEKLLLNLRTDLEFQHDDNVTVRNHHHKVLLDRFECLQKTCDPSQQHTKPQKSFCGLLAKNQLEN